jgi:polar amino acid transport system substrate-binding protein
MKRVVLGLLLSLVLLVGMNGPALATENASPVLSRIVKSGQFRVGTSGTQPPFTVKSKSGDLIGYEIDLANILATAMGVELKLVQKPFGQLLAALEKGEVDAVMSGMTMTPDRNLKAAFVGPYVVSGKSILTKDKTLVAMSEVTEINRATIRLAALENSTSQKFVELLLPDVTLVKVKDYDEAVRMVLEDEVTAVVADYPICVISALRYGAQGLVTLAEPLTIEPIGIALPPGDSLLLNMVQNYLGALEGIGLLEELEAEWFDDASWLIQLP